MILTAVCVHEQSMKDVQPAKLTVFPFELAGNTKHLYQFYLSCANKQSTSQIDKDVSNKIGIRIFCTSQALVTEALCVL